MKTLKILMLSLAMVAGTVFASNAQEKQTAKAAKQEVVTFKVNLHCESCVATLEKHIPFEKGVKDMKADARKQTVRITYDPAKTNESALRAAIEKLGYKVQKTEPSN